MSALVDRLLMPLPPWLPAEGSRDAWQITAWGPEPRDLARTEAAGRG